MALYTTKGVNNIPEGAVRLSREEALKFQKKIITRWKSLTDVVFIQYGWAFPSASTFASSVYITKIVRSLLNMGSHARLIPYGMTTIPGSMMSAIWTEKKVTESTLLMSKECPMCLPLRFCFIQILASVITPIFTSFALHLPLAQKYSTAPVPDITQDKRHVFKFCYKLIKSKALQFKMVAALQVPLVVLLPYLQEKQMDKIVEVLRNEKSEELEWSFV